MSADKIGFVGFLAAVAFLAFVAGGLTAVAEVFPHDLLRAAYKGGRALIVRITEDGNPLETDLWRKARTPQRGVTLHDPGRAYDGYTLYTSGDAPEARLIAMDGTMVHAWTRPYSEVWTEEAAVDEPQPDDMIYMRKARMFPNGDLLAIYAAVGDTPWGYGMVKLDRNSRVLWRYLDHTHHDFDVAPDGRIYALIHAFTSEEIEHFDRLGRPRLDDFVVVLSPDGRELARISITHALVQSRYKGLLYTIPAFALDDPLHTNAVEYITPDKAENFPHGRAGQILLSFREPGVVAVLDPDERTIAWATRGPWLGQHDPSLLDNGNILLFDNLGTFEDGNASQIVELEPATLAQVWRYRGDAERPFESAIRSAVQRLPNGNTLITESDGGRLFEVTPEGRTVWEYVNPVRAGDEDEYLPVVSWGQRIDPESLERSFRARLETRE